MKTILGHAWSPIAIDGIRWPSMALGWLHSLMISDGAIGGHRGSSGAIGGHRGPYMAHASFHYLVLKMLVFTI